MKEKCIAIRGLLNKPVNNREGLIARATANALAKRNKKIWKQIK
jgi:hypothetical protein